MVDKFWAWDAPTRFFVLFVFITFIVFIKPIIITASLGLLIYTIWWAVIRKPKSVDKHPTLW